MLRDLLVTTKDGDWGKSEPTPGHLPYRVIRGTDFPGARIGDVSTVPLRHLPEKTVLRRTLQPNDILLETAGGSQNRPTGRSLLITARILRQLDTPATCASFARFLRVNPELADPAYVYWYLQNLYISGEMDQHQVRHTGVARFQYTWFAQTQQIPLPSRAEQHGIVATLCALDDKIESNCRTSRLLHQLVEANFALLLERHDVTWLPFDAVVERISVKHKHSAGTVSPRGTTVVLDQSESGILGYHSGTPEFVASANKPLCLFGDHTCSWRLAIGAFDVGPNVIPVSSKSQSGVHQMWMYYGLLGAQEFQEYRRHWMEFKRHPIPWISEAVQTEFVSLATPLIESVWRLDAQNQVIADLRDSLLPELLSGRIRVPEAARAVEEATA